MAKLYFRHGTMNSAKTLNLLAVAHNYRAQGKKVLLLKPKLDDRFGAREISSRAGVKMEADALVEGDSVLDRSLFLGLDCVLVDEAQFLSPFVVEQLREITHTHRIPVICYGLRTDFRTRLFDGSRRLLELADSVEEVKVTCQYCNKKAILNMRIVDGHPTLDGAQVQLGAEESYVPVCFGCFDARLPMAEVRARVRPSS